MSANSKEDIIQEQILHAAKQLFAVHGLAKVTMDDVAKAIGKSRSSLYYYYKSKDEIFDAVVKAEINALLTAMEKAADNATTVEEKIRAFLLTKLQAVKEIGSFFNAIETRMDADAITNFKNNTKIVHHHQIVKREGILLSRILHEGVLSGELTLIKHHDMDTLIFILLSCLRGLKDEIRLVNNITGIEPVIKQFTSLILNGLRK